MTNPTVSILVADDGRRFDPRQILGRPTVALSSEASRRPAPALFLSREQILAETKRRLQRLKNTNNRKLLQLVLEGMSFAPPGERDSTLQKIASVIAFVAPDGSDPAVLAELVAPSLAAMAAEANEPGNPAPTFDDAAEKIQRALVDAAERRTSEREVADALMRRAAEKKAVRIIVDDNVPRIIDEAESVLLELARMQPEHAVFARGDALVEVTRAFATEQHISHPTGAPRIRTLPTPKLIEILSRAADWEEVRTTKQGDYLAPCWPPEKVAKTFEARGRWRLPELRGISETPVLRADGTVLSIPGYDPISCLIHAPSSSYPPVAAAPSRDDARAALDELLRPFVDFPWVDASDRSVVAALILTILARHLIDGPVPLFAFSATTPGSGKSLAVTLATTIATGHPATVTGLADDEAEADKRLLAIGLSGAPVVHLDDLPGGVLGTAALSRALTSPDGQYEGRLLGSTRIIRVPMTTVFVATANNVQYQDTLARRVIQCSMAPACERPEDRTDFTFPDVVGFVKENRARLVVAGLTTLLAYLRAGCPLHGKPKRGSYERWDDLIRGAICWAGLADPAAGCDRIRADADRDVESLREFMTAWVACFESDSVTIAAAQVWLRENFMTPPAKHLRSILFGIDPSHDTRVIGRRLGSWRGRLVGGRRIESTLDRNGVAQWRVATVEGAS